MASASGAVVVNDTTRIPAGAQLSTPTYVEEPSGQVGIQSHAPVIRVYKDTNAWFGENRDNATLVAMGKVLGDDYFVHPISACSSGIPAGTDVVLFTSNGFGLASSTAAQNAAACQASLSSFVAGGGVLIVDMGDNDAAGGYRAPGAVGTPSYVFPVPAHDATLAPAAVGPDGIVGTADDHPIVKGPDGMPGTADDLNHTNIDACCFVAHGNLADGIALPGGATTLITATFGGVQKPILAEYCLQGGRVILDTITKEFAAQQPTGAGPTLFMSSLFSYALGPGAGCIGPPAKLVLDPKTATNTAGEEHCVTATVTDANGTPTPGVTVRFSVSGANSASGSATTDGNGQAEFCYTGTVAGTDTIDAFADTDNDGMQDDGEPGDTAKKTYVAGPPATLTLDPKTATNPVDSKHCVTATVKDRFGNPVPDVNVRFSVTGSVNTTGSVTTDANGQASFCYTGPALPGADLIKAYADTDGDNVQDAPPPAGNEPFDTASKAWVLPVTTPGCEIKITNGGWIVTTSGDRASFGGNAKADEDGNVTGNEEYQDHGPAQPMNLHGNVLVVVCNSSTSATIFGEATIDGSGSHTYRIDVQDLREPGKGFDRYRMRVNAYDSGDQVLKGGNVQVHKS